MRSSRLRVRPLSLGALHTLICDRFGKAVPEADAWFGSPRSRAGTRSTPWNWRGRSTTDRRIGRRTAQHAGRAGADCAPDTSTARSVTCCSPPARSADATVDLLADATKVPVERVVELLEGPEREGIVQHRGQSRDVRASPSGAWHLHPGGSRPAPPDAQSAGDGGAQPELRARHMALGAASADPETLQALDAAAAAAVARGAAAAAAELYGVGHRPRRRHARSQVERGRTALPVRRHPSSRSDARSAVDRLRRRVDCAPPRSPCWARPGWQTTTIGRAALLTDASPTPRTSPTADWSGPPAVALQGADDDRQPGRGPTQAELAVANAERLGTPKLISQALTLHVMLACAHGGWAATSRH